MKLESIGEREPWMASLDRVDSDKGYTLDNVRFVTWMVNCARADWNDSALVKMCRGVIKLHG